MKFRHYEVPKLYPNRKVLTEQMAKLILSRATACLSRLCWNMAGWCRKGPRRSQILAEIHSGQIQYGGRRPN